MKLQYWNIRELKQQRRRQLRKGHLESEFALFQSLSRLFHLVLISFSSSNVGKLFWNWALEDWIKVQEKKKKVFVLCPRPPKNVKIEKFHVTVVQWQLATAKKCTKKRDARAKLFLLI